MENPFNRMTFTFFTGKKVHIILHLTVWIILFILSTYLLYNDSNNNWFFLSSTYMQIFLYAVIFYANYLWLSPKLFFKQKKVLYFIAALSLVAISTLVTELSFKAFVGEGPGGKREMEMRKRFNTAPGAPIMPKGPFPFERKRPSMNWPIFNFILTTLFLSGFGMGLSFSDKLRQNEKERKEAEKENLNTELAFLKYQINPHFFFNTLNNIYSLVEISPSKAPEAIHNLSKLMRYLLYDTGREKVELSQEIHFLKKYIQLMELRQTDKTITIYTFPDTSDLSYNIAPLLFIPLIENAYKHGVSATRTSHITFEMTIKGNQLLFSSENSNFPKNVTDKSGSGIGLYNLKKRLELLYQDHYKLKYGVRDNIYWSTLQIEID